MRTVFASVALALALLIAFVAPVAAGPFEDGYAAYKRGDIATAEKLWRPFTAQGELRFMQSVAEVGDAEAQTFLGYMYYAGRSPATGKAVAKDYAAAVKWFRLAAKQGSSIGQTMLGVAYAQGHGVPQDYVEAVKWFRLAAEQGLALGQYGLGAAYARGQGVPQDYAEAARWYRLAAAQGDANAKAALADLGTGNRADPTQVAPVPMDRPIFPPSVTADGTARVPLDTGGFEGPNLAEKISRARPMPPSATASRNANSVEVALEADGGTYLVPVQVNGAITLGFTVDSGAADVTIPADVFSTLQRAGTIETGDMLGTKTYVLADGSTIESPTFRIRSLRVGDTVLENVTGSVAETKGMLLLGQSFLKNFKSWSIDNSRQLLVLTTN